MADWTDPPWAELTAGKPWTDEKAAAAFENPIAIAEAAADAPRVVPAALQAPGVSSGAISGTTWAGFTGLGAIKQIRFDMSADNVTTPSSTSFDVAFSADGGLTWGATQILASVPSNECLILSGHIDLETGVSARVGYSISSATSVATDASAASTLTVPANCNAIRFRFAAGARAGRVYLTPIGGRA